MARRDDMSEETAAWVKAENAVTFDYLDRIPFRDALKKRLETLLDYERVSAPYKEGDYEYVKFMTHQGNANL
jgi:prolyl oligopeptidase